MGTFFFAGAAIAQEESDVPAAQEAAEVSAVAQDSTDDYVAVWSVIEEQWEAAQRGDRRWVERYLHEDFRGWPKNSPAPRDKASTRIWNEFGLKQSKGLEYELYPLSTVILGDTAVAHYLYSNATESKDGEAEVANGRFTDVLIRVDDEWKFIAWHGGDDSDD